MENITSFLKTKIYLLDFSLSKPLLNSNSNIINSMLELELLHWDYLDNYNDIDPTIFSYIKFKRFLIITLNLLYPYSDNLTKANFCLDIFSTYQKNRKVSGSIIHYENSLLLVGLKSIPVFSFPKGKANPEDHDLFSVARRETLEETGVDIKKYDILEEIEIHTKFKKNKVYFLVFPKEKLLGIPDYKEIISVKYFSYTEILKHPHNFTYDVKVYADFIINKKYHSIIQKNILTTLNISKLRDIILLSKKTY